MEIVKTYKPGGGNIQIVSETPRWTAHPKIDSLGNITHRAGGGNVQITDNSLEWNTSAKVGSLDNVAHHAGGGGVKIPMKIWPYPKGSMDELPSPVTGESHSLNCKHCRSCRQSYASRWSMKSYDSRKRPEMSQTSLKGSKRRQTSLP